MSEIHSNDDLRQAVEKAVSKSGLKKSYIAEQINMTNQYYSKHMSKKNFSLDDAQKILDILGLQVTANIESKKD